MKYSMMKMKISPIILIGGLLFTSPAFTQEVLIDLDVNSPEAEGLLSYPPANLALSVHGTDAKDQLTRPWFPALPILGEYKIVEINNLPQLGPVIRLQAQTGKGQMLQRFGKGGLLLSSHLTASGLWRSRANTPLNTFGVLSTTDKAAFSQLTSQLTVEMPVFINSLAEKNQVRWFEQETMNYWLSPEKILVPVPKQFVTTASLKKAIVLDSETTQVLTLEIENSLLAQLPKPEPVKNVPFPQIAEVAITVWRVPEKGAAELVGTLETNTNAPFIFQQLIPKILKQGDKILVLCIERLAIKPELALTLPQLLSKAQADLPKAFTLTALKNWLDKQTTEPLHSQMLVTLFVEQTLRPAEVVEHQVKWTWPVDSKPIQLENSFYPLLRIFIYAI